MNRTNASVLHRIIGRLVGAYMLFCGWTTRWTRINEDGARKAWAAGKPLIVCYWHGRIMQSHVGWRQSEGAPRTLMLISQSKEGEAISQACMMVGLDVVRGSTDKAHKRKGGAEALRTMVKTLRAGGSVAITPDGPKGPRMRVQPGVIQLARLSGASLICLGWSTRPRKVFNSWDQFMLPLPFGRGAYVWSDLLNVPRDADDAALERARLALENELTRIAHEADRLVGAAPIEPAEASPPERLADAPTA
ncbi:MAG: lysophospholipid acyltransferase family protein [Hyphomonadaceae bacterium]|nr:lysophospholipid acyltransferase family protein [Hyphomonadaceae bacterium]